MLQHTKSSLSISLFLLLAFSCKTNNISDKVVSVNGLSEKQLKSKIKSTLERNIDDLPTTLDDSTEYMLWYDVAKAAYQSQNNNPIWVGKDILNNAGKQLYNFIDKAEYYALLKEKYQFAEIKKIYDTLQQNPNSIELSTLCQLELMLTKAFLHILLHVDNGMYDAERKKIKDNFWNQKEKYVAIINTTIEEQKVINQIRKLEPQHPIYKRYSKKLYDFVSKNNISPNNIIIRDHKKDSLGAIQDARSALKYHHYLHDTLVKNDSAYIAALKQFQRDNGYKDDGVIGSMTARALERNNAHKFMLLVVSADKWRASKNAIKNDEKYVWVNLPSYKIRVVQKDALKIEKNAVIGKANKKNATPNIISAIDRIVLWPTWSVPQSIIKNEMKSFKGYRVTKKDNYTSVIQPPGPRNALGAVKILFPNSHSVYMHDTPTKYLFSSDYRSHSHGCIRCQDPLEIASTLLQLDTFKFDYDSLIRLKEKKIATRQFLLKNPIPIYIQYFTAEVDWSGKLNFFPDVYNRDKEMIDVLFNNVTYNIPPKIKITTKKDSTVVVPSIKVQKPTIDTSAKIKQKDTIPPSPVVIEQDSSSI